MGRRSKIGKARKPAKTNLYRMAFGLKAVVKAQKIFSATSPEQAVVIINR